MAESLPLPKLRLAVEEPIRLGMCRHRQPVELDQCQEILETDALWAGSSPPQGIEAAWIPAGRLTQMRFALPPLGHEVGVIEGEGSAEAVRFLEGSGWRCCLVASPRSGSPGRQYRLWSVPRILEAKGRELKAGRALCLGCGAGREAIYFASLGWQVTAVDHLPDALDRGKALASLYSLPSISWVRQDAVDYAMSLAELPDLMTSLMYFDPRLIPIAETMATSGGTCFVQTYSEGYQNSHGHPRNPRLVLTRAQLPVRRSLRQTLEEDDDRRTVTWVIGPS